MSHGSYDLNLDSEIFILARDIRLRSWTNIVGIYGKKGLYQKNEIQYTYWYSFIQPLFYSIVLSAKKVTHLGFGHFITISGHFFANYINIFHKAEVLMNIFRWQKYLNLNWIKDYNRKHNFSWFHFFQFCKKKKWKFMPHKWLFYDHFWPFLVRLHQNLSQNWGSDGFFEVLGVSVS